ncbi:MULTISPECIES: SRPBCC family protein [unclassified Pandoraea]|uniref:SRPBCC family protein n=1 Tax=unclassified Pandoraea TaxID=2624094 RepID=UPI000B3F8E44|nr:MULTISPECIES: SRPBCC family protein [unclassified Pandoraea]
MQYEHLIEVNDLLNPLAFSLSREQLWNGLVLRAEQPANFVLGLDECILHARTDDTLERELRFGQAVVRDRVIFTALQSVRYETAATEQHAGGTLTMAIEEPSPTHYFVRFIYSTTLPEDAATADTRYSEFVKSAYREADIDTIAHIRALAEQGALD